MCAIDTNGLHERLQCAGESAETIRRLLDVNLATPVTLTHALAPRVLAAKGTLALALALGIILIGISVSINATVMFMRTIAKDKIYA